MPPLSSNLRRELERTVIKARDVAEAGARVALEALTVHEGKPGRHLDEAGRALRNRLRAHARQLGDRRNSTTGAQAIDRLRHECAYEHWHRMLFARFLAENDFLIEAKSGVSVTLEDVEELAREANADPWELASRYAQGMLPQIFRPDDPVLAVALPTETRLELEGLLEALPRETFLAEDSLGWVYQFWQSKRKDEVNASGEKITGDTIAAVTQLFTEHYMVLFLLHNTLGAWHAGKVLAARPELTASSKSEQQLRDAVAVHTDAGNIEWTYLRFVRDAEGGPWRPAAGVFAGWPRETKDLKILDPCCGSGHFLVAALQLLVRLRMHEEGLSVEDAVCAVIRDNLFGLEIDQRCVQLAAFNVALAAWTLAGRRIDLPELHIACSGIGPSATLEEWLCLVDSVERPLPAHAKEAVRNGLENLYRLFSHAPELGSLIDPKQLPSDMYAADYETLFPFLQEVFRRESSNLEVQERAVAAHGMARAAELLSDEYTLVVTNVPYLATRKQSEELQAYCTSAYPNAKNDLGVSFLIRCISFTSRQGTAAIVVSQYWLFKSSYEDARRSCLKSCSWPIIARLGPGAFDTISGEVVNVCLGAWTDEPATEDTFIAGLDVTGVVGADMKSDALRTHSIFVEKQLKQLENPQARIVFGGIAKISTLEELSLVPQGVKTGDDERWRRLFWELPALGEGWIPYQTTVREHTLYGGRSLALDWRTRGAGMVRPRVANLAVGMRGVAISQSGSLPATIFTGERFDSNVAPIVPKDQSLVPALWAFCTSDEYVTAVRRIDQSLKVTNVPLVQVPFDEEKWRQIAEERGEIAEPCSNDPTQWVFNGRIKESVAPLQVAVAWLLGYGWPEAKSVDLDGEADVDGVVCIPAVRSESTAADRVRRLLKSCYGHDWSAAREAELLAAVSCPDLDLDEWLRTQCYEQHCKLFRLVNVGDRPFIWHIWDGKKDGFHALINYHKLAAADGAGRRLLDKLTHVYLRDWINSQRHGVDSGEPGAEGRLAAAETLKRELEKILEGEPPYDLFIRWKPLHEQPIGWNPDINDGVRLNIRPFMMAKDVGRKGAGILRHKPNIKWGKDRGKEPQSIRPREDFPWFWGWDEKTEDFAGGDEFDGNRWNDLHYTNAFKQAARETKGVVDGKAK